MEKMSAPADKQILTRLADFIWEAHERPSGREPQMLPTELAKALLPFIEREIAEHAKLVQAAAIEAAAAIPDEWRKADSCDTRGDCQHQITAATIAERIRALASQDLLARHDAQIALNEAKMWRTYTAGKDEPYWCAERIAELTAKAQPEKETK